MSIDQTALRTEIRIQHADLESWLGTDGAAADTVERFLAQLHPEFSMVALDGAVVPRPLLAEGLRAAGHASPGLRIDIIDIEILHLSAECAVVRFEEVHQHPEGPSARLTTALLVPAPHARNGLLWRSVHETASAT
ncbi:hypothetical protein [Nocardia jejuensis]|uniref:hypothetical protein n=1 Tax=Nocardia jejuensis TaxID=328049 RepID=UPI00082D3BB4|nr:hypothetical protein [Nocardia jejuensis]